MCIRDRYDDHPSAPDFHTYTGLAGSEQLLEDGKRYAWKVDIDVSTILGDRYTFSSVPYSFTFESGDLSGSSGIGDPTGDREDDIPDMVFELLRQVFPPDVYEQMLEEFRNYTLENITIDDFSGRSFTELSNRVLDPKFELVIVEVK